MTLPPCIHDDDGHAGLGKGWCDAGREGAQRIGLPQGSHWDGSVGRGTNIEHHDDGTVLVWSVVSLYPEGAAIRKVERVLRERVLLKGHDLAEGTLRIEGDFAVGRTLCLTHACDGEIA